MHGGRFGIVEDHCDFSHLRLRIYLVPARHLAKKDALDIIDADTRINVEIVLNEGKSVVCELDGARELLSVFQILEFRRLEVTRSYGHEHFPCEQFVDSFRLVGINGSNLGLGVSEFEEFAFLFDNRTETLVRSERHRS